MAFSPSVTNKHLLEHEIHKRGAVIPPSYLRSITRFTAPYGIPHEVSRLNKTDMVDDHHPEAGVLGTDPDS
jgi:hypothetical protein